MADKFWDEIWKQLKKKVGMGPGRPRKGQTMIKTGTDSSGRDTRRKGPHIGSSSGR